MLDILRKKQVILELYNFIGPILVTSCISETALSDLGEIMSSDLDKKVWFLG